MTGPLNAGVKQRTKILDKIGFSEHTYTQNFDKKFKWYVLPRSEVV